MEFNLIDVIVFSLFFILMVQGYHLGLIKQITIISGIILGGYIAFEQYGVFANFINQKFSLEFKLAEIISFILLVVTVSFFVNYVGHILSQVLDIIPLSIIDNLVGVVAGFFKAFIISYILVLLLEVIPLEMIEEQLELSYFAPKLLQLNPVIEEKIIEFSQY
ncbi:CvpA family protein [Natroniella sulfidigena]|uniref:CvpA family protein n=1 Tax=Natroniella sulfidigena TaxID=723921 RepID=UPI00200B214D|nr:CvpA family protein [Natroniella sulfidigena]